MADTEMSVSHPRIGVLLHVFYLDILPSLLRVLPYFPRDVSILVSTPAEHRDEVELILQAAKPEAALDVQAVPNLGFDIAPMLVCFAEQLAKLDLVCKLHTKRSAHYDLDAGWREYLIHNLAGSNEIVSDVLSRFSRQENLGVVFPSAFPNLKRPMAWNSTHLDIGRKVLGELKVPIDTFIDFPAGSMFWFRPPALKPLLQRQWVWNEFKMAGNEGLAHVLERVVLELIQQGGYTWQKLNYLGQPLATPSDLELENASDSMPIASKARIAVVLHIWAINGLHKAIRALKNIPQNFDLFVTLSSDSEAEVRAAMTQHFAGQQCKIIRVANIGHDIAPFFSLSDVLSEYELVCKIHLKQRSSEWFDYLLDNLLGGVAEVKVIQAMFARNPKLGMVYPKTFPPVERHIGWGNNFDAAQRIASAMNLPTLDRGHIDFITSTMFWCRPQALVKLFNFSDYQFREEHNQLADGGESHAVERLILISAKQAGYQSRAVCMHTYSGDPKLKVYPD